MISALSLRAQGWLHGVGQREHAAHERAESPVPDAAGQVGESVPIWLDDGEDRPGLAGAHPPGSGDPHQRAAGPDERG